MRLPRVRFTVGSFPQRLDRFLAIAAITLGGATTALFGFVVAGRQVLGRLMPLPNPPPLIFEMEAVNLALGMGLTIAGVVVVWAFPRSGLATDSPIEQSRRLMRTIIAATVVLCSVVVVLVAAWLDIRSASFSRKASEHYEAACLISPKTNDDPLSDAKTKARYSYHCELCGKYRDLSSRPWLPVSPDPPEPE
jgi:hypothetical protein